MKSLSTLISASLLTAVLSACGGGGSDSTTSGTSSTGAGVITNACVASASGAFTVTAAGCTSNNQTLACQGSTMRILSGSKTLAEVLAGGITIQAAVVNFNGVQYKCE
jgi:ABC-type Fe3+-hydroxamate transport system substrate-binding protein